MPVPIRVSSAIPRLGPKPPAPGLLTTSPLRPPVLSQLYVLPKGGIASQPSVMQVRSLAAQPIMQSNGTIAALHNAPKQIAPQPQLRPTNAHPGAVRLLNFLNQLLELSKKNVSSGTHTDVVRLVQSLINREIGCETFCTQLKANLKSENNSMDLGSFIQENIEFLRLDMSFGNLRLPNIQPPPKVIINDPNLLSSVTTSTAGVRGSIVSSAPVAAIQIKPGIIPTGVIRSPTATIAGGQRFGPAVMTPLPVAASGIVTPATLPPGAIGMTTALGIPASGARFVQPTLAPAPPRIAGASILSPSSQLVGQKIRLTQPTSTLTDVSATLTVPVTSLTSLRANVPAGILANSQGISALSTGVRTLAPRMTSVVTPFTSSVLAGKQSLMSNQLLPHSPASVGGSPSTALIRNRLLPSLQKPILEDEIDLSGHDDIRALASNASDSTGESSQINDLPFFPLSKVHSFLSQANFPVTDEAAACLAHGLQLFIKSLLMRLSLVAMHKSERLAEDPRLVPTDDVREQLRFIQRLGEHDKMRQSEIEKELILKAAKSRSKHEDPDQLRVREMARRIANENYEREKQRQANLTALSAIGPQRKRKFDSFDEASLDANASSAHAFTGVRGADGIESRLAYTTVDQLASAAPGMLLPSASSSAASISMYPGGSDGQESGRIGLLSLTTGSPVSAIVLGATGGSSAGAGSSSGIGNAVGSASSGASFTLANTLRIRRVSLRNVQLVFSKDARLRRSRTYYKTFWRMP